MSLEEDVIALRAEVLGLREVVAQGQARLAELEQRTTPPPSFVPANTPTDRPAAPRRKRAPVHNAGRRREEPTQLVSHAEERCPGGYLVRGQSVARSRQVIDLPEPAPVEVTAQRLRTRPGPACDRWWMPHVDFGGQVVGQGGVGVRLVSVIASLRQSARLLATLHAVRLARGARRSVPAAAPGHARRAGGPLGAGAGQPGRAHGRDGLARERAERLRVGPADAGTSTGVL